MGAPGALPTHLACKTIESHLQSLRPPTNLVSFLPKPRGGCFGVAATFWVSMTRGQLRCPYAGHRGPYEANQQPSWPILPPTEKIVTRGSHSLSPPIVEAACPASTFAWHLSPILLASGHHQASLRPARICRNTHGRHKKGIWGLTFQRPGHPQIGK